MLIYLFAATVFIHAVVHFIGFAKTFGGDNSTGSIKPVPGHQGWLWLLAGLLLTLTGILMLLPGTQWLFIGFIATFVSQTVIIVNWKEAKWGTIINVIILAFVVFALIGLYVNFVAEKGSRTKLALRAETAIPVRSDLNFSASSSIVQDQLPDCCFK